MIEALGRNLETAVAKILPLTSPIYYSGSILNLPGTKIIEHSMAGTEYSKLETNSNGEEDFGYTPKVRRRRSRKILTSPSFTITVGLLVGVLATLGGIRLCETIGKRDTDWLSKLLKCSTGYSAVRLTEGRQDPLGM